MMLAKARHKVSADLLAADFAREDYFAHADPETLDELQHFEGSQDEQDTVDG